MPRLCNLIIADDHHIIRQSLRAILEKDGEFSFLGEACNGFEVLDILKRGLVPDILILDLSMPEMSGLETLQRIRQMDYSFEILVLTMHREQDMLCRAFAVGADGYMLKDGLAKELTAALHTLSQKKIYLSPFIATELPDTCRVKASAGQNHSSALIHCGKNRISD
jgi:DNA-binding NarL/FixJ family response regulator